MDPPAPFEGHGLLEIVHRLRVIEVAVGGKPLSRLYQQNRAFDIALRFPEERRESVEALGSLLVDVPGGYRVSLGQLADLRAVEGPTRFVARTASGGSVSS
jgi:Cu/Ag efflux pump CusA